MLWSLCIVTFCQVLFVTFCSFSLCFVPPPHSSSFLALPSLGRPSPFFLLFLPICLPMRYIEYPRHQFLPAFPFFTYLWVETGWGHAYLSTPGSCIAATPVKANSSRRQRHSQEAQKDEFTGIISPDKGHKHRLTWTRFSCGYGLNLRETDWG